MREPNVLDEQIIKALESTMYTDEVRRAAYDLIMRQRREIERLTLQAECDKRYIARLGLLIETLQEANND